MKIVAKPRGNRAVMQKMAQLLSDHIAPDSPYVMLTGTQEGAQQELEQMVHNLIGKDPVFTGEVGCAVSINSGPKMIGIGFMSKK